MRTKRLVHPGAWWLWAAGLATAGIATSNPLLLLALCTLSVVVATQRGHRHVASTTILGFVKIAVFVVTVRIVIQVLFGQRSPGHTLFTIPSVTLPSWLAGVSLGGPVTTEALLTALQGGLKLAVILLAFGAANALASPRDLLRSMPGVFHEVAVAITVALCFTPELMASVRRLHEARRLRGRPTRGIAGMRGILVPALEDALESATMLAASMGSRGFGRSIGHASTPRLNRGLVITGVLIVIVGGYGVLASDSTVPVPIPVSLLGLVLVSVGVIRSHRRAARTRYRRASFTLAAGLIGLLGWIPAASFWVLSRLGATGIQWSASPLSPPPISPWGLLAIAVSGAVLFVAPAPVEYGRVPQRGTTLVEAHG